MVWVPFHWRASFWSLFLSFLHFGLQQFSGSFYTTLKHAKDKRISPHKAWANFFTKTGRRKLLSLRHLSTVCIWLEMFADVGTAIAVPAIPDLLMASKDNRLPNAASKSNKLKPKSPNSVNIGEIKPTEAEIRSYLWFLDPWRILTQLLKGVWRTSVETEVGCHGYPMTRDAFSSLWRKVRKSEASGDSFRFWLKGTAQL